MTLLYNLQQYLPTSEELPYYDETPVDSEVENLIPNLLLTILSLIWSDRQDWFLGIDMAIYYEADARAVVPDGFLSIGVERRKQRENGREGRLKYVIWEEDDIIPLLFLEIISKIYNREHSKKKFMQNWVFCIM